MKRCVYCGLEIEESSIVCKYCTRQIPLNAVTLDYPGKRFGLGRTETSYALWDLTSSTPPLAEFVLTAEGWDDAWYRFQQMEAELGATGNGSVPMSVAGEAIYPKFPLGPQEVEGQAGRGYTIAAWVCAGLAIVILPIILGPVGMVLGGIARSKGDTQGTLAIFGALAGMIVGFLLAFILLRSGVLQTP